MSDDFEEEREAFIAATSEEEYSYRKRFTPFSGHRLSRGFKRDNSKPKPVWKQILVPFAFVFGLFGFVFLAVLLSPR